jgi:hypothetical protein
VRLMVREIWYMVISKYKFVLQLSWQMYALCKLHCI